MGNETEKDVERQQTNPTGTADQSKKNPMQQGGQNPNQQQDPSKKNPSQGNDPRQSDEEGSDQVEKRRAS
jgi:hypothetical protein